MKKLNIVSLFSGAGGLDIAACSTKKVGTLFSTDANQTFLETTIKNFPSHFPDVNHFSLCLDARNLSGEEILKHFHGPVDVLMGGPPCEDFSIYGRRLGSLGDKAPLILEFSRLVKEVLPKFFLFENVPNLAGQFRHFFALFLSRIEEAGYQYEIDILSARDYGAPTIRKRLFVVGWSGQSEPMRVNFKFPAPSYFDPKYKPTETSNVFMTVKEALAGLPDVSADSASKFYNHTGRPHKPSTVEYLKTILPGKKGAKSYRYRAPLEGQCHSLTAGVDYATKSYIHPVFHREMSAREYARIHGFPDTWELCGNHHNAVKQAANAVPIQLGSAVLQHLFDFLMPENGAI